MSTRQKHSARNLATAATLRGIRAEKGITFAQLQESTGIKEAQLERLFRNEASFKMDDFASIAFGLRENPGELLDRILAKVVSD